MVGSMKDTKIIKRHSPYLQRAYDLQGRQPRETNKYNEQHVVIHKRDASKEP